jgi:hypothetical protein
MIALVRRLDDRFEIKIGPIFDSITDWEFLLGGPAGSDITSSKSHGSVKTGHND